MSQNFTIPTIRVGNKQTKVPIIQGGMGVGISLCGLASAVANEGGIGVISATGIGMTEPDYVNNFMESNKRALRAQIQKAKSMSSGIIGVNILVALSDYEDLLRIAIEEEVDVVFLGAGLPIKGIPIDLLKSKKTAVAPIVSSARSMNLIFSTWEKNFGIIPDLVVVEGPMAGGHLGYKKTQINDPEFALEVVLPTIVEAVKPYRERFNKELPVIAAGGIFTGSDIRKMINLGASGVQMGTRFVATFECDASNEFKQSYIDSKEGDVIIIESPVGLPGRSIKNEFLELVEKGGKHPSRCPWKCLKTCNIETTPYCIAIALNNARKGNMNNGFAFAGSNAYRVSKIVSVHDLVTELMDELKAS